MQITEQMVTRGVAALTRRMRRDSLIEDFSETTLRSIVREIFLEMSR